MQNDLDYSNDPLGLVLSNYMQINLENRSSNGESSKSYVVPLNIIGKGELFGVFGTIDALLNWINNDRSDYINRKHSEKKYGKRKDAKIFAWNAIAGDASFQLLYQFYENSSKRSDKKPYKLNLLRKNLCNIFDNKHLSIEVKNKEFVKTYGGEWYLKVVYFPKHFLFTHNFILQEKLEHFLFKKGWEQSSLLRNTLLEYNTVFETIKLDPYNLEHDEQFLSILYDYIIRSSIGEAQLFVPLLDETSIEYVALKNFVNENEKSGKGFTKASEAVPVILKYGILDNSNEFGLLSVYHLPIPMRYEITNFKALLNDLEEINQKIRDREDINTHLKNKYSLPQIEGFKSPGGMTDRNYKCLQDLTDEYLKSVFNKSKIQINQKEYTTHLLIKKKT
jgi:hypothetical protein